MVLKTELRNKKVRMIKGEAEINSKLSKPKNFKGRRITFNSIINVSGSDT